MGQSVNIQVFPFKVILTLYTQLRPSLGLCFDRLLPYVIPREADHRRAH